MRADCKFMNVRKRKVGRREERSSEDKVGLVLDRVQGRLEAVNREKEEEGIERERPMLRDSCLEHTYSLFPWQFQVFRDSSVFCSTVRQRYFARCLRCTCSSTKPEVRLAFRLRLVPSQRRLQLRVCLCDSRPHVNNLHPQVAADNSIFRPRDRGSFFHKLTKSTHVHSVCQRLPNRTSIV